MEPDGFIDRSQRFSYLLACENARRSAADPSVLRAASDHLERFGRPDPHQRKGHELWRALLDGPAEVILALLVERSPRADNVRETAPAFPGMPVKTRTELLPQAGSPTPGQVDAEATPP